MLDMDNEAIAELKAGIKDLTVLEYIGELESQNDRLHSHHSDCKKELGELVQLGNKWKLRAHVAEQLAHYLNSLYLPGTSFMSVEQLSHEINIQTLRLMEKHRDGISFMPEDLKERRGYYEKAKEPASV